MKEKVVVGMSGGVDSAVAACLLKEQGYEVIGVTMKFWPEVRKPTERMESGFSVTPDNENNFSIVTGSGVSAMMSGDDKGTRYENNDRCGSSMAIEDAERVAQALDIPHYVLDFEKEFRTAVVDYFVAEYLQGRTPNPCTACNRFVKWEALLKRSKELGADYIATGHYARIAKLTNGRYALRNSVTAAKDQTYALYNLTQFQLAHTLMPLGEYTKEEIRQLAVSRQLPVAHKPDSQEICFIPDDDYAGFIRRETGTKVPPPGNFVTENGEILGRHKGITHYTVGQRRGLGLAMGHPIFVTAIRSDTNEVVVGEDAKVYASTLRCHRLNFMGMEDLPESRPVTAKIRYAHKGERGIIKRTGTDEILCTFEVPVRAITPGQAVVFYDGGYMLGGGTIVASVG